MMMASIEIDSNESKLFTIFCSKITFRNILHNHTPYTEYKYTHTPPSGRSGDHLDATENCKITVLSIVNIRISRINMKT